MKRDHCIVCGAPLLPEPIYRCKGLPAAAQNLPTKENVDKDKPIDLDLRQCGGCGLVQFDCDPVPYYKDSTRAGERSRTLTPVCQEQFRYFVEKWNLQGKKILEIGAGKGGFLKTLEEMGYQVQARGIEYNEEFVRIAREQEGVEVQQGDPESISTSIDGAPYDAFYSFAYPARLLDPNAMLQLAWKNLKTDGLGLIRVPSMEHLLKPGGFYDLTVDHVAYFDKDTLRFWLQRNGFDVLEQGEVGQVYIYAIVKKRGALPLNEIWADVDPLREQAASYIRDVVKDGRKLAVWCAGHFAFTLLSMAGIRQEVSYIIDNAPFKQGCFAPGSHIPIVAPSHFREEPVDEILILGPIYVEEIVNEIRSKCSKDIAITTFARTGIQKL